MKIEIFGEKIRITYIIFALVVLALVSCHTLFSCSDFTRALLKSNPFKEGMTVQYNINEYPEARQQYINTKHSTNTNVVVPPEEMHFFSKNKFEPECCPSSYSSSTGCACVTPEQLNFLNTRGGNRS